MDISLIGLMDILVIILRVLHLFAGVFWMGAVLVNEAFLLPTVRGTGPVGGQFMTYLVRAKSYPTRIAGAAIVTILAGLALYWRNMALSNGAWAQTRPAMVYGIGGAAAIIALYPGIMMSARSANKLAALGESVHASGKPPTPEQQTQMAALQKRLAVGSHATAGLTAIALMCMAIARYIV